jgi:adenylate cyclase
VRRILDDYYDYACRAIFAKGGTVMQFVGDEVFAVFGAPEPLADPAAAARDVGLALQAGASELTRALEADGLPPVRFGVGVHVGEVVAAHVGPDHRRQYAVIGDAVNVASRLCGIAEAGDVVVSVAAAGDLRGSVREVELKGVDHPVAVLTLHPGSEAEAASPGVGTQSFDAVDGDGAAARRDDHHVAELPEDLVDGRS